MLNLVVRKETARLWRVKIKSCRVISNPIADNSSVISFVKFTAFINSWFYLLSVCTCWNVREMVSGRTLSWPHFKFRCAHSHGGSEEISGSPLTEFEPVHAQSECSTLLFCYEFSACTKLTTYCLGHFISWWYAYLVHVVVMNKNGWWIRESVKRNAGPSGRLA